MLSADLTGDAPKSHVVIMIGEDEYATAKTLPVFARADLEPRGMRVTVVHADAKKKDSFPGLVAALGDAELLLVSVRRRLPPSPELVAVREYVESGRPIVGIRTSSHAFEVKGKKDGWPEFDKLVLGGSYQGHYANSPEKGPPTVCQAQVQAKAHPILRGIPETFESKYTLYRNQTLAKEATPLLWGTFAESRAREHVSWTHVYKGARIFYTSLGGETDFANPAFRKLLRNGVLWGLERMTSDE
jgi:type 1 glutamine amidotransferase